MSNYNNGPYAQQQQQPPQSPYYQYQGPAQPAQEQPFPAPAYIQYVQPAVVSGQPQPQQQYCYVDQPQTQQVYYEYTGLQGQQQQPQQQQAAPAQMPMPMPMPFPQSPLPQQQQHQPLQMPAPAAIPSNLAPAAMPQPAVIPTPVSPVPAAMPQPAAIPTQLTASSSTSRLTGTTLPNQPSGDGSAVVAFAPSKVDDDQAAAVVNFKPSAFDPTEALTPAALAQQRPPSPTPAPVLALSPTPPQNSEPAPVVPLSSGSLAPDRPWYLQKKWQISLSVFACSFIVALCSILGHTRFIQAVNDDIFQAPQATKEITAKSVVFLDFVGVLASVISLTVVVRFSMVRPGTIIPLLFHRAVAIMSAAMTALLLIATTLLFVRLGSDTGGAYAAVCDPVTQFGMLSESTAQRFSTACGSWRACIFFGYVGTVAWLGLAVKSYTKWVSMRVEKK